MSSWNASKIQAWLSKTEFNNYQGIDLPFGLEVPGPRRDKTVDVAFSGLTIRDKTALVIGSHYGAVPNILADRGARVWAMEARPAYANIARTIMAIRGTQRKIDLTVGNAETHPLPVGRFDFVTLFNVNHHFVTPVASLRKIAGKAKIAFLLEWATYHTYNERHDVKVDVDVMEAHPTMLLDKYNCWYMSQKAIEETLYQAGFSHFVYSDSPRAKTRRIVQCRR